MHYQLLDLLRRASFQIKPIQLNLLAQSVVTSTSNMSSISTVLDKGMNTYAMESFKCLYYYIWKDVKKLFFALQLWCMECRVMWEKVI